MAIKAIKILVFYVNDIAASAEFYSKLGFKKISAEKTLAQMSLGPMTLQFVDMRTAHDESFRKEAVGEPKGRGIYIDIEVEGIDGYYQSLVDKGLKPSSAPRDWPWGHREFVIRDPDGYKLVFYQKITKHN